MRLDPNELRRKMQSVVRSHGWFTREECEDAVENTMCAIYTHLHNRTLTEETFGDVIRMGSAIAHNKATDIIRARKRGPGGPIVTGVLGPQDADERSDDEYVFQDIFGRRSSSLEEELERKEMCAFLIKKMSATERTLITLCAEGDSYVNIAEALEIPSQTVKSRIHELRQRCKSWKREWDCVDKDKR